jgi:ribosomal protein S18 acetylase RimI-like enzyme
MAATTQPLTINPPEQLRRLNLRSDLNAIADLVESAFEAELDNDGRRYIRQMRATAKAPQMLGFAGYAPSALTGFVWIEEGRIVGNLSMIPVQVHGRKSYLIANVAVEPEYRRQGIARMLTQAALADIAKRGAQSAWLQVRAHNPGAVALYRGLGFMEMARRSTWHSGGTPPQTRLPAEVAVRERQRSDWPQQERWLRLEYPATLTWQLPLDISLLRPGLSGAVNRLLNTTDYQQWACTQDGELIGTLSWQSSHSQADWLWFAGRGGSKDTALRALLPHALSHTPRKRQVQMDYAAGQERETFEGLGFEEHVQLIWMRYSY